MRFATLLRLFGAFALLPFSALAQFTINGVTDKATPNDTATLTVVTQAGYTYSATLNYKPIAVGAAVVLNKPDFYELRVSATNTSSSAVSNGYLRFIINASERASTEVGLPPHTPFSVIQSSPAEFVGARLRVLTPTNFPTGYEIPVVAWVVDAGNHAVRANGLLAAPGQNSIQIKRGVGSGFLASNQPPGVLNYTPSVGGISSNKPVNLEAGTVWTSVVGTLGGVTTWPDQSRIRVTGNLAIPAGSSLTIGAGSIVLLNSGVNITNDGAVVINGNVDQPVIFMPNSRSQPWGGFFMRSSSGSINATGAIFVASGANPTGGAGHRPEQCLFLVDNSPSILLSDSAAIFMAGQLGHAYGGGTFTYTRFLMQHATTGGEYTGASFTVNDSAFIECPDDTVNFVDGDNDALYLVSGNHTFTNTLFGWTKDDGIDSGGDSVGSLTYNGCWFEATFHEGNSLSGSKTVRSQDTIYLDCGQGLEDGYGGPNAVANHCLFSACQSGLRHGDNYKNQYNYTGTIAVTNSLLLNNHRDVFAFNWNDGGWTNASGLCFASNNFLTSFDAQFANNALWNPAADGWRLGSLGGVGRAGVGFGVRSSALASFADGIPVGLSRFCTNEVHVDYSIDGTDGTHSTGTLVFPQGLTRQFIPVPTSITGILRVALSNPLNADITGNSSLLFQNVAAPPSATPTVLSPLAASWKYLDDGSEQGTAWRGTNFNDTTWSNGVARLGFATDFTVATTIRKFVQTNGVNTARQVTNYYFRRSFVVTNAATFTNLEFHFQRDDGCIVYVNSNEVFRTNMPGGAVTANTFASATISPNTLSLTFLTNSSPTTWVHDGTNTFAVEMHQSTATSSDILWEGEIVGVPPPSLPRVGLTRLGGDAILYWTDNTFALEEADMVTGPWRWAANTNSPSGATVSSNRFFRLRK